MNEEKKRDTLELWVDIDGFDDNKMVIGDKLWYQKLEWAGN